KSTQPRAKLQTNMAYVEDFSDGQVKAIGIVEILGGIGLVLPMLTGVLPWLTPAAAFGLAITMVAAAIVHIRRGEGKGIAPNVVLLALSLFVGFGWAAQLTA
ncbi:DoxX family protein, partial [Rhizobium johnstonii]|uniref:DoxX family protein n=1 Tax=Rhizobium johnstonii TaxID=3019933 RepID=UPI003F977278